MRIESTFTMSREEYAKFKRTVEDHQLLPRQLKALFGNTEVPLNSSIKPIEWPELIEVDYTVSKLSLVKAFLRFDDEIVVTVSSELDPQVLETLCNIATHLCVFSTSLAAAAGDMFRDVKREFAKIEEEDNGTVEHHEVKFDQPGDAMAFYASIQRGNTEEED